MNVNERDIRRVVVLTLVVLLAVLVYLLVKPILLSIIGGLILAYAFYPVYRVLGVKLKSKNFVAILVSVFVVVLIMIPLYFLTPLMIGQVFGLFEAAQGLDKLAVVQGVFPSAPESFVVQAVATLEKVISDFSAALLSGLVSFLIEIPTIMFHFVIVAFVFFYALRDSAELKEFVTGLSPFGKVQEKRLVKRFKDITNAVVYGQVLIGLVQGLIAGLGFFLFGIPSALVLTVLAIAFSVIPIVGPFFVWLPAVIYLFAQGSDTAAVLFLLYNLILVSNVDNLLRLYILSRKARLSQVIVLIGMIGGLFIFGLLGLIIGPLLLAYFVLFLNVYRDNALSTLFREEKTE